MADVNGSTDSKDVKEVRIRMPNASEKKKIYIYISTRETYKQTKSTVVKPVTADPSSQKVSNLKIVASNLIINVNLT